MKKICMAVLGFVLCLSCMCACGPLRSQGQVDASIDVDENISATLKIAVKDGEDDKKLINSVAAVFNETYKNVKVEIKPFSNDVYPYMMSAVKTGTTPDIVISTSFEMFQLKNSGMLYNLQKYIDAEEEAGQFDMNDYYDAFMRAGQENFDGDQYLIPRSADRVVCHYNADLMKQADAWYKTSSLYNAEKCESLFDLIVNGWTWDDFDYVCSVVRAWYDENGKADRYILDGSWNWEAVWNPILASYGVEYIGDNKQVLIDSEQTREALDFMKSFVTKRYTSSVSSNFYGGLGMFFFHSQAAKAAAAKVGQTAKYYEAAQAGRYSEFYNVVSMPVREGHENIGSGIAGYCVYAESPVANVAWKFLKTLLTQEGQNAMSEDSALNYVPVRKDMSDATKWAWGKGLDGINLDAYLYNSGKDDDPDWNCFTDFFLKKPSQALNLLNCVGNMVSSYVLDQSSSITLEKVIGDCKSQMTGFMNMR
ncbi:MAG: extracellular solute-binding protein [Clostridia bacterium]|nr:extracellular solute-binding protein [Clostridia bacterium]